MITTTQTQTRTQQVIHLKNTEPKNKEEQIKEKQKKKKSVQWTEDTVDNENLGRLKSNICCIYTKPRAEEESESSDDTCTSDDETNAIERDKQSKQRHREKCSKKQKLKKCC